MNVNFVYNQHKRMRRDSSEDNSSEEELNSYVGNIMPRPGKKTRGRVKVKMELIKSKLRRYTTFSKRKTGIMKKAYELATLTGTQVMILVASETGHVYTFATQKLQPMITSDAGKALIQTCLNSPDPPPAGKDCRMTETGYEEVDLSYHVQDEDTNHSTPNLDDPQDSIAASNSQASSREPSPETDTIPHSPPVPPLMTIPPHVMTQLLKTAQNITENKKRTTEQVPVIPFSLNRFPATSHNDQPNKEQQLKETSTTIPANQKYLSVGPLSFKGNLQNPDKTKPNREQPKMSIFRPIEPNDQLRAAETPNKNTNPPIRPYKNIAPNPIQSPAQLIMFKNIAPNPAAQPTILTNHLTKMSPSNNPNLRLVLPSASQHISHTTSTQDTGPQNLSLPKRK